MNYWNYHRLTSSAQKIDFAQEELRDEGYFSQCGQDKLIAETILPEVRSGVFVDIGAHDGVTFSNTLYLEQQLGWTGLAIEPIPEVFELLRHNRRCSVSNVCVGPRSGKAKLLVISGYSEMLSGLVNEYEKRHIKRIKRELKIHGGEAREIEVDCYTLSELIDTHKIDKIDYLCIDVEGAEYSVLNAFDFSRCKITVISVENNYRDCRIPLLLKNKGFQFHSIVGDEFYIRRNLLPASNPTNTRD